MKKDNLKKNLKVIKNKKRISSFEEDKILESELLYLSNIAKPDSDEDDLSDFAENYSEENDDELNGLYAHYNIVKKNINANYRNLPEYKEYRKMWRETAVNHIKTDFPLHLDIEVTSYCNLACPMCP